MMLFESKTRTDLDYSSYSEENFAFLDRSAMPKFEAIRDRINSWFSAYPENLKARLKNEFIKKDFPEAFFELYCYQRLLQEGWQIQVHPEVDVNGKLRTPDFLITKGAEQFYVEVTTIKGISDEEVKKEKRRNVIREKIVQHVGNRFAMFLSHLEVLSNTDPNTKKLLAELDLTLQKLEGDANELNLLEGFKYHDESLEIEMTILSHGAMLPLRDKKFAIDRGIAVWGDNVKEIQKALLAKAKKYRHLPKQLIIMLNVLGPKGLHEIDIETAIYGDTAEWINEAGQRELKHKNNGLFSKANSAIMQNVARLFFTSVTAWHGGNERVFEFENPDSNGHIISCH